MFVSFFFFVVCLCLLLLTEITCSNALFPSYGGVHYAVRLGAGPSRDLDEHISATMSSAFTIKQNNPLHQFSSISHNYNNSLNNSSTLYRYYNGFQFVQAQSPYSCWRLLDQRVYIHLLLLLLSYSSLTHASVSEILDSAPIDLLGGFDRTTLDDFPDDFMPASMKAQALDFVFHWVNETGETARMTSGLSVIPTVCPCHLQPLASPH